MKVRVPEFYRRFVCLADKCEDTCCAAWEVDVDSRSRKRYAKVPGDFGDRLRKGIRDGHFVLDSRERCPFLDENNLCEIYRKLGRDSLCDICREHPRFVEVYGDLKELGLGLCCEESVALLLERDAPLSFVEFEDGDAPDEFDASESAERDRLFGFRSEILRLLSDRGLPLADRLAGILAFAADATGEKIAGSPVGEKELWNREVVLLDEEESLGAEWDLALGRMHRALVAAVSPEEDALSLFSDVDGEKIASYQIFRYFEKSLYDCDPLSKVKFAVWFFLLLRRFGACLAASGDAARKKISAVKLLSKQLEYSEENMASLAKAFAENSAFSTRALMDLSLAAVSG